MSINWSSEDLKHMVIGGMIMIALIECWALYLGFDGVILTTVVSGFAAFIGVIGKTIHDQAKR